MNYKQKFIKYKRKIQFGSASKFVLNLDEWTRIPNLGQQNCGIFISKKYPEFIVKCNDVRNRYNIEYVNYINSKIQSFPLIINRQIIDKQSYITMQKLDGDITDIYFNLIPNIILNDMIKNSIINEEQKNNIYTLFKKHTFLFSNDEDLIKSATLIRHDIYDNFLHKLFELWELYHPIITKEMIKKRLLLITLGFDYVDNKYDNYGYILKDIPENNLTPKLFDKYLHVYCLDWDSGLFLGDNSTINDNIRSIIKDINNGIDYAIFIGSNFNNIFKTINNPSNLDSEMFRILQKKYILDLSKFKHSFTNITEVEQYIFGNLNIQHILDHGYSKDILLKQDEIQNIIMKEYLESSYEFKESGQDISNFKTNKLLRDELTRLDYIKKLKLTIGFIESGQDIRNFYTIDDINQEINRLEQINILANHPLFIASGKNIKDFQTIESVLRERKLINLKDDLMHSEKFKASGIDINSINFSTLTRKEIDNYENLYIEW